MPHVLFWVCTHSFKHVCLKSVYYLASKVNDLAALVFNLVKLPQALLTRCLPLGLSVCANGQMRAHFSLWRGK